MRYYLVRLSYTAAAWKQLLATPLKIEQRLKALDAMLALLGARVADIRGSDDDDAPVIRGKFAADGDDDLIAVLVFPDEKAAMAFSMAVSAEEGVRDIRMTPMMPLEDALYVMRTAAEVRGRSGYSAPGGTSVTWTGSTTAKPVRPAKKRS